jgi:hypothetical protein
MATRKKSSVCKKTTRKKTTAKKTTTKKTPPPSRSAPRATPVLVKEYVHMSLLVDEFLKENPNGAYLHTDRATKAENESVLKSLPEGRPVFISSKKTFTAAELKSMGFDVFQNGKDGKLVGIRK